MVAESLNIDNQFPVNSSSLPRTKTIKMVHKKKHISCSKNSQSQINSTSSPIVTNKSFTVFHQNIRGLRNKSNELLGSVLPNLPHVVCLTTPPRPAFRKDHCHMAANIKTNTRTYLKHPQRELHTLYFRHLHSDLRPDIMTRGTQISYKGVAATSDYTPPPTVYIL
jgi:hypothetical protein